MSAVPWSNFYPDVILYVERCPYPLLDQHLRNAVIELCSESQRYKFEMPPFDTVAGTPDYTLEPGDDMETVCIIDAAVDGAPIDPVTRDELASGIDWTIDSGKPSKYLMVDDDETVRLWKNPDAVYSVALTLAIKPNNAATGIEQWFADRYRRTIAAGALSTLLLVPKRPWTDLDLAAVFDGKFRDGIRTATAQADKDGTAAPLRTTRYGRA